MLKLPNFKKIIKPNWSHKAGFGISAEKGGFVKQNIPHQGTIPSDKNLLKKLGIKKKDKVLAIAGYYADWASAIKNLGAIVDYSDISCSLVNYVLKNVKTKFRRYICLGYEHLPKKTKEYDWTFTYEACGGKQGLPIAYLRALLNNKGGILMVFTNPKNPKSTGSKLKTYPNIVNILSKIYKAKKKIRLLKIKSRRKNELILTNNPYLVCQIITNDSARKKAETDIKILEALKSKNSINLKKQSKTLCLAEDEIYNSLKRLNKLTLLLDKKFVKDIKTK